MRPDALTVHIVDDDPSVRDSIALMLGLRGFRTSVFASAEDFLAACQSDWRGCALVDVRLPGRSGVELQAELQRRGIALPVIVITAHGDVATARAAFRSRAVDFLEKPFEETQLVDAVEAAFALEARRVLQDGARRDDAEKLGRLTPREREVLAEVTRGLHAKEIAVALGISPRTVEVHRARIMEKLGVRNVAELVRLVVGAEPPAS